MRSISAVRACSNLRGSQGRVIRAAAWSQAERFLDLFTHCQHQHHLKENRFSRGSFSSGTRRKAYTGGHMMNCTSAALSQFNPISFSFFLNTLYFTTIAVSFMRGNKGLLQQR
ncbi:hypothetical protein JOB18_034336 [Solea senegalensis]|nr:hypothetical protein JOB18_034336 [Solea senegalensis]